MEKPNYESALDVESVFVEDSVGKPTDHSDNAFADHAPLIKSRIEKKCCGQPEKKMRVIILVVASIILVGAAIVAGVVVATTPGACAAGFCAVYANTPTVFQEMPNMHPSFLRFEQTAEEQFLCEAPLAFLVGGLNQSGWAQRWTLAAKSDGTNSFVSATSLVNQTSRSLNWPHSIAQDPCSGTLFVANADDNAVNDLPCSKPLFDNNFHAACDTYGSLQNFSTDLHRPLGLHQVGWC